jgi:hypothetical protein
MQSSNSVFKISPRQVEMKNFIAVAGQPVRYLIPVIEKIEEASVARNKNQRVFGQKAIGNQFLNFLKLRALPVLPNQETEKNQNACEHPQH